MKETALRQRNYFFQLTQKRFYISTAKKTTEKHYKDNETSSEITSVNFINKFIIQTKVKQKTSI